MGVEPDGRYNRIILLIVESGAIISATKLTEFTLFNIAPDSGIGGLNAMYILYEIVPQMTVRKSPFLPLLLHTASDNVLEPL